MAERLIRLIGLTAKLLLPDSRKSGVFKLFILLQMKKDIETREDLALLMEYFYDLLLSDPTMAPIFLEVAQIDLKTHLPHLIEFWHSLLFMTGAYRRNVMLMHIALHRKFRLEKKHFDLWLGYFEKSVRNLFAGPRSEEAINRAHSIAQLMQFKISQENHKKNML